MFGIFQALAHEYRCISIERDALLICADNYNKLGFYDIIQIGTKMLYLIKLLIKTDENLNLSYSDPDSKSIHGRFQSLKIIIHPEPRFILKNSLLVQSSKIEFIRQFIFLQ